MICNLCPRNCNALRNDSENIGGYCKMPSNPKLAHVQLHFWEEPIISGKNGSGTVFFSGCSLGCVFCQNAEISQKNKGKSVPINRLSEIFSELEKQGANNINLVTPSHFAPQIINALEIAKPKIPIVYNSSGYEKTETLKLLQDYVDIYLIDFKYLSSDRARLYSNAPDYPTVCTNAIKEAYSQQPNAIIENGIMKKGVIVRHLLMPSATNEAIDIFNWVSRNVPNAYFSLMSQFLPLGKAADMPVINRKITKREYNKVVDYIIKNGFENCYIQELTSASGEYIPNFDFSGI